MENQKKEQEKNKKQKASQKKPKSKFTKIVNYILLFIIALIVAKYIVVYFIPSSQEKSITLQHKEVKKIKKITINYEKLKPEIEKEYNLALKDIYNYTDDALNKQKQTAYYNLSKKDGFLDWIFGWIEGYKIMWHKIKGWFGSKDNEKKLVADKFDKMVIKPGMDTTLKDIQNYTKQRINDYIQGVVVITTNYLNSKIKRLKDEGYKVEINSSSIPFAKYGVSLGVNAADLTGITEGIGITMSKVIESKLGSLLGAKAATIIEAKTASIIAAKIASAFELLLAPVIDYAANETVKEMEYDKTKKAFEGIIDNVFKEINYQLKTQAQNSLNEANNIVIEELNRKTVIKGRK